MIIVRSPLRISLGGGGTDIPSYYLQYGGFLISGAIDKYVYITLHRTFYSELIVKYSKLEHVKLASELEHPILREAFSLLRMDGRSLELTSMADVPAGTGLGSSGAFAAAVLKALHTHQRSNVQLSELAEQACSIEIERLREPVGKQDPYISVYGGITSFEFSPDGKVTVVPVSISQETVFNLEDNLMLFFTGFTRAASSILADQHDRTVRKDQEMLDNLHFVKETGRQSLSALQSGNLQMFAELMHAHWERKRKRSRGMSDPRIDHWYELARRNGAIGGKLIGAGGGGVLALYVSDGKERVRRLLREEGLKEIRFRFDFEGTKVIGS
jgi:D-glycero-alpha-D-manno-heptose-7-phosphate kinase